MKKLKYKNRTVFFLALTSFVIVLSSCAYSSRTAVKYLNESKEKVYDLVVVPGVPFQNDQWSMIMKARLYWSKYLYDNGIAKNIMYSGAAVYSPYYEAEIMAMYAEALGIPKQNIFIETNARHSTENIYYSYKKAKQLGFKNIALATDPFQSKMLRNFISKRIDKNLGIVPIVFDTLKSIEPVMINPVIDFSKAHVNDFISILESEGFWTRFKGTLGKQIDVTLYDL